QTLEDVGMASEVGSPHSTRLVHMSEGPLHLLAALTKEPLPALTADTTPISVHRFALLLPSFPVPAAPIRLRAVAADIPALQPRQPWFTWIPLAKTQLTCPCPSSSHTTTPGGCRTNLITGLPKGLAPGRGLSPRRPRNPPRHDCTRIEIHRVFGLVGQM